MPKFYTTDDAVGAFLGITLTPDQVVQATALLPMVEDFIDHETQGNGGWLNGPIVGEHYNLHNLGHTFYLRSTPVLTIESITRRTTKVGDTPVALVAGTDYELLDPSRGQVTLADTVVGWGTGLYGYGYGYGDPAWNPDWGNIGGIALGAGVLLVVSYTPLQVVPPSISQCATEVLAFWLVNTIDPGRYGITAERTADEQLNYSALIAQGVLPATIDRYLQNFSRITF